MQREDFQEAWEKIVDKGFSKYRKLTQAQQVWFNVEPLITGGLIDHYVNYGAEHNKDTIENLELLGFEDISDLLKKINQLFKKGKPPKNIDKRNDEMFDWDEKYEDLLNQIDKQFWNRKKALEQALLNHIISTGIGV